MIAGPSVDRGFLSSSSEQGASTAPPSAPTTQSSHSQSPRITSENNAPLPTSAPPSTSKEPALAKTDMPEINSTPSLDVVWAETLELAKKKLGDKNLPLDLTTLTSKSAGENIRAVIEALDTLQRDEKKNRWSYTWHGKEVIFVERLGKILKTVEPFSKVVDTAIQANPQVTALVWAGVLALMRVCIHTMYHLIKLC